MHPRTAAPEFRAVVQRWPTGNKAPDAMLKLGFTLAAQGKTAEARTMLRELPSAYPHTEAARLAEERLLGSLVERRGEKHAQEQHVAHHADNRHAGQARIQWPWSICKPQ